MENLTTEQWLEKYPYLKEIAKYTLFTTVDDIEKIKNSEKLKIDNQEVSIEFLKRILKDYNYYDYAYRFFSNEISSFCVSYIIEGDTGGSIYYQKPQIIKGLEQLILLKQLVLQPEVISIQFQLTKLFL